MRVSNTNILEFIMALLMYEKYYLLGITVIGTSFAYCLFPYFINQNKWERNAN
ncbi:hypothetical protein [Liquorilactobacillus aquaticus]|uniref:hypothetical protein n=1 Tax=Liquorilactobacillus aquaticus TaxID=392566 RepID=UPI0012ED4129|nr:hypothetical protein [Liquorilactobacillus aquaticus]